MFGFGGAAKTIRVVLHCGQDCHHNGATGFSDYAFIHRVVITVRYSVFPDYTFINAAPQGFFACCVGIALDRCSPRVKFARYLLHAREGTPMTKIMSLLTRGVAVLALVVTAFVSNIGTYALGVAGITTIAMTTTATPASAQRWRRWRFRRWRRRWW